MAQEQNVTVEVQPNDTINSLIERLVASGGRSINLVVPQSAPVPSTLPEFEQLRELERRAGLRLTLAVDPRDRTRFGLAKILSFNVRTIEAAPMPATEANYAPSVPVATPPVTPPPSHMGEPPRPSDDADLPPDIAEMNFDEEELAASQPPTPATAASAASPNRPRIIGSDDATSPPRSSGRLAVDRLTRIISSDDAASAPPAPERDRPADQPHTEQRGRILVPAHSLPLSSKIKIKAKTDSSTISPDAPAAPPAPLTPAGADDATAVSATPATTRRPPSQSKTAAVAALGAAPPRTLGGPGRQTARPAVETVRDRERSRLAIFALFAVLLVIILGVAGYAVLSLSGTPPSAKVALTPRTVAVSQRVSVPIALGGQAHLGSSAEADYRASPSSRLLAPAASTPTITTNTLPPLPDSATAAPVAAQQISANATESGTINTTAHRDEPRGNDSTTLKIVNTSETATTIPASTLVSAHGYTFAFPTAVVVPGSNLLQGSIGTTIAKVTATSLGPSGVAAFTMVGSLGALRYENTDSAKGGYIEHIPTVSEADYNNLVGGLIAKVNARIPDEINAQVGARVLITPTFGYGGDPQVITDHKVGDDSTSLSATVTRTAHEYAFDPKDASQAASLAVQQSITQAASNVKLDPGTIRVNEGQLQPAPNGYVYQASATATATYITDQATLDGVRQLLAGHKVNESASDLRQRILARYPTLADAQIQLIPGTGNNDGILAAEKITVSTTASTASGTPAPAAATATP